MSPTETTGEEKDNEIMKMKIMHSKQQIVFKRRVEQAEALNKRLKNALALRKQVTDNKKSGQADKIEPWVSISTHNYR